MFQNYFVRIKVKLNTDLSHYRSGLTYGLEGYTIGNAYQSDTYNAVIDVYFKDIGTVSVVLDKLDIIDDEYIKFLEKKEEKFLNSLKKSKDIIKYVGPKGGFKHLDFTLDKEIFSIYDRSRGLKIESHLEKLNKTIKEEVI